MLNRLIRTADLFLRIYKNSLQVHAKVFSHSSLNERLALFYLAKNLPDGARAIEIGSHIGSSALFICAGLSYRGGHLVCVDTWMNQTMPDGEKDTFALFKENTRPYVQMLTCARKFSCELTADEIGAPLDFVFIDGDHSEESVRADFRLLAPSVKLGGLIAFHDVSLSFPGVNIVIGEALASREWQITQLTDSLGVIKRCSK